MDILFYKKRSFAWYQISFYTIFIQAKNFNYLTRSGWCLLSCICEHKTSLYMKSLQSTSKQAKGFPIKETNPLSSHYLWVSYLHVLSPYHTFLLRWYVYSIRFDMISWNVYTDMIMIMIMIKIPVKAQPVYRINKQ